MMRLGFEAGQIAADSVKNGLPAITKHLAVWMTVGGLVCSQMMPLPAVAQAKNAARLNVSAGPQAAVIAEPLPEDRGAAALEQSLKRLGTWASLMMIVAHPDDEDGSMLTYESRGLGVRTSLLTLTRGEGGQNAMSADDYDALGILRTNELLRAGEYYGVKQYWGTEADFGFSKTLEEAFERWGHERVLYDTVLAVRRERPMVLVSSFQGGITDGHGQHQVSGEITQEAYLAAGDPKVFPEQIAAGLEPWTPLKVYARVPFAPVTEKGMFDYATGKWAPAKFYNYVTKKWTTEVPKGDAVLPDGNFDPVLGRSYVQIARQGWGEQKSQNGGGNPTLSGGDGADYHLYGSRVGEAKGVEETFFAGVPTGVEGIASLVRDAPDWLTAGLKEIAAEVAKAQAAYVPTKPELIAPDLKAGYLAAEALRKRVSASSLEDVAKADVKAELETKATQFQTALGQALGLDLQAFTVKAAGGSARQGPFGGGMDETARSVTPGQTVRVKVHTGNAFGKAKLARVWLESADKTAWGAKVVENPGEDSVIEAKVPADEAATEPSFTRPTIEQAYYDVANPALRGLSFAPYPLAAWAEFDYDGVPVKLGEVVQTMARVAGRGGVFEPLVVTPAVGVRLEPGARILPLDGSPLPVKVTVHSEGPVEGKVRLTLPAGWSAVPEEAEVHTTGAGDTAPILFKVKPAAASGPHSGDRAFAIEAKVEVAGRSYASGWRRVGYAGMRPYNIYRKAEMMTRAIDVKVAPGLRVGYVMGTGDTVPEAIEGLGVMPHLLSAGEIESGDLSAWDVIVIGIRAYSVRPELSAAQSRLNAFVQEGGTLVVQYQTGEFPAPLALRVGGAEKVVEEAAPVKVIAPANSLMSFPNQLTSADFSGWVEERGHSFLDSWDPAFTALTETADVGQDPQKGGLIVAHPGKGTYIYMAYAVYRQLPELVPGSYRILANLLSAGKAPAGAAK